jgi:hypothetical protein
MTNFAILTLERARLYRFRRSQITMLFSLGLVNAACHPHQVEAPAHSADAKPLSASPAPHTTIKKSARFVLWHAPALGIKTALVVHVDEQSRALEVLRTVSPGYLRKWRVRLGDDDARLVDELVAAIIRAGSTIASCPRRHARDDIVWSAMTLPGREEFALDFHHEGGPAVCDDFEHYSNELMRLAKLKCVASVCLRPEEALTGTLECVAGPTGDVCRENPRVVPASTAE